MNQAVSYDDVQETLIRCDLSGSAAEIHGVLSGMLCMDISLDPNQWLSDFFGPELEHLEEGNPVDLHRLFDRTRRQLVEFDFTFEPLLPDDEASLEARAVALGEWCHGFLQGIGYTGLSGEWLGECTEILRDFLEIVRLDANAAGETDEQALTELSEYVRVGVQVIRSEFENHTSTQRH